ncbi:hypothetical protein ACFY1S_06415 [Micromonospora sp. NPDC000663]|uniref:hypothetical protein n=1 Tax=Micromonospora sp. NPDC000663 TaxID=3364218 RepID=UPI0036BF5E7A
MTPQRVAAIVLFLVAFLALGVSHAFPFREDISGVMETAIVLAGVTCALGGVRLWLHKTIDPEA